MKRKLILLLLILMIVSAAVLAACVNESEITFDKREYDIHNGESVSVNYSKAKYVLITQLDDVILDADSGKFTVSDSIADCTQVIVAAKVGDKIADTCIVRLRTNMQTPEIEFSNLSQYIVNGDSVSAVSTPLYSVSYSLKQDYDGIEINSVSGKVTFGNGVADNTEFTVVAKAKDVTREQKFFVLKSGFVTVEESERTAEYKVGSDVKFTLDYAGDAQAEQAGVLAVTRGHGRLSDGSWSYDKQTNTLTIAKSYVKELSMGNTALKVTTAKNTVTVNLRVATYVATASELAAINSSREALGGTYVMVCDIDLTKYLSSTGDGYDNGCGWRPIGTYFDVLDGTATDWAFCGSFDGNGHTISGFFMNRSDDYAYNSGLFGYITGQGEVKNLGLRNAEGRPNKVRSYSGGFVGVNVGKITDCWADVDVLTGEVFKVVGGFVGRNEGVITNCYSLGSVSGGSNVGCFAGVSRTDISYGQAINCYAVKTGTFPFSDDFDEETCKVAADESEMANCNFSAYSDAWTVEKGKLPALKSTYFDYDLRELDVSADRSYVTRGETLQLNVVTNPIKQELIDKIEYKVVEGKGVRVSKSGLVNTSQVQRPSSNGAIPCVIEVTCLDFVTRFEFEIYDKITDVKFTDTMESVMYAGNSYKIDVEIAPLTANQSVTYRLSKKHAGVTLNGDTVTVSNYADDGTITVVVTATNGDEITRNIEIVGNKRFDGNFKTIYRDDNTDKVSYAMPDGVAGTVNKVTMFDKKIPFTLNGNSIEINKDILTVFEDREVALKFHTDSGIYTAAVVAYDSEEGIIKIGSVEEFMAYKADFMDDMRPEGERKFTDEQLRQFRGKTVFLTADLDFENVTITSIGSHHVGADFTGLFNGNGYTIKNLNIDRNEFTGKYVSEENVERGDENEFPYHASRYNVGLFSFISGRVYNVRFENVAVASYYTGTYERDGQTINFEKEPIGNYVGIVAGTVSGSVSNCTFVNCTVKASGELKGIVCGKQDSAQISNCRIDGELYEK